MKRLALPFAVLALSVQFIGCDPASNSAPPPPDKSNLPPEVREYEAKEDASIAKKIESAKSKKAR